MTGGWWRVLGLVAILLGSQGCTALGLVTLGAGVGTGAGQGVSYTLDSIVYKTSTTPVENLESVTSNAFGVNAKRSG